MTSMTRLLERRFEATPNVQTGPVQNETEIITARLEQKQIDLEKGMSDVNNRLDQQTGVLHLILGKLNGLTDK